MRKSIFTLAAMLGMACTAHAEIAVIGHPSAASLSKEQVSDIYLGVNLSAAPIDQVEANEIRSEFYSKATGRTGSQAKAIWSRIVFSGKGQPPKEVASDAAVKKAVAADPKAVGYIDKAAVDGSVKVLLTL